MRTIKHFFFTRLGIMFITIFFTVVTLSAAYIYDTNTKYANFYVNDQLIYRSQIIEDILYPEDPYIEGYTFIGWYQDLNDPTAYTYSSEPDSNLSLYAKFEINTYTVSFDTGLFDDVLISSQQIEYNSFVVIPQYSESYHEGYAIIGWYIDDELNNLWDFSTNKVTGNLTLYAKWAANTYLVSFDAKLTDDPQSMWVVYGMEFSSLPNPTKDGYTFLGWYLSDVLIESGDLITITNDSTLIAKWEANTYTVNFDAQGITNNPNSISITYESTYNNLPLLSKDGYTFLGWYLNDQLVEDETIVNTLNDITLIAKWQINGYLVSFNTNGGNSIDSVVVGYNDYINKPLDPIKEGYTFLGWYKEAQLLNEWDFDNDVLGSNNITLYAKWSANYYEISFNTSTSETINNIFVEFDSTYPILVTPKNEGYTFLGWYLDDELITSSSIVKTTSNQTLYAKWEENIYEVSFDSQTTIQLDNILVSFSYQYGNLPTPTKEGYTFLGWYDNKGNLITSNTIVSIATNHTLSAMYEPIYYTAIFITNNGSNSIATQVAYEDYIPNPSSIIKDGYTLIGWYTDQDFTTIWDFTNDQMPLNGITLYAKWQINTYDVLFETNGGTQIQMQSVTFGYTIDEPLNPTKEGYTFLGWYLDSKLTTKIDFNTYKVPSNNIVIYAKWDALTFVVTLNMNIQTPVSYYPYSGTISVTYDSYYYELVSLTKDGYTFLGWYLNDDLITSSSIVKITSNQELIAKWKANNYTVSFDENGAENTFSAITVVFNSPYVSLPTPTKSGQYFLGWYTSTNTLVTSESIVTIPSDHTLYAKWLVIAYYVTFDTNGGSPVTIQMLSYNEYITIPNTPTKTGYTFDGWYLDYNYTTKVDLNTYTMPASNITLYAKWNADTYMINFYANTQDDDSKAIISYYNKEVVYDQKYGSLPSASREGYTFLGWYTSKGILVTSDTIVNITNDQSLYAHWEVKSTNITLVLNNVTTENNVSSIVLRYDDEYMRILPLTIDTDEYIFDGWYLDENFQIPIYPEDIYHDLSISVIYAKSILIAKYVYFDTNGATSNTTKEKFVIHENTPYGAQLEQNLPQKAGYYFDGWTDVLGSDKRYFSDDIAISGTHTLYATWLEVDEDIVISGNTITSYRTSKTVLIFPTYSTTGVRIETINSGIMASAKSVTSITLPRRLVNLGSQSSTTSNGVFLYSSIKTLFIPKSVKTIGNNALTSSILIESVIFEEGSVLESIGSYAFMYNSALTTFELPNTIKSIGMYAFTATYLIQSITIPASLTSMGQSAFAYWKVTQTIIFVGHTKEQTDQWTNWYTSTSATVIYL